MRTAEVQKCTITIPVSPELHETGMAPDELAASEHARACAKRGLKPLDQKLAWHGSVSEARMSGMRELTRDMPDDWFLYCFKATAIDADCPV